ncbi:J domain-containing protein [Aminomonas paucivorans]|uniref:J domain-containing protein n=1 Tax=Aminomonas paucivorans TaxID=81412 RepID=UPI0033166DC6
MSLEMDFRTLGLPPGSDWEDVKSAFRRLARTYHPDVAGPEHSRRFAEITRAYMSLKESIQAPSVGVPSRPVERPRTSRGRRGTSGTPWWDPGRFVGRLQRLWRSGRASFARRRPAEDTQRSPARDRFVEEALDRAEMHFRQILGRRVAAREEALRASLKRRLESRHPGVVLLALDELARSPDPGYARKALVEHLNRERPDPESLRRVLSLFPGADPEGGLARALSRWGGAYAPSEALSVIRWLRGRVTGASTGGERREWLRPFLTNSSPEVAASALQNWPAGTGLPDVSDLIRLFRQEDAALWVALLRLIRREGVSPWMLPHLERLSRTHPAAPVRVWAAAIVRDRAVG